MHETLSDGLMVESVPSPSTCETRDTCETCETSSNAFRLSIDSLKFIGTIGDESVDTAVIEFPPSVIGDASVSGPVAAKHSA